VFARCAACCKEQLPSVGSWCKRPGGEADQAWNAPCRPSSTTRLAAPSAVDALIVARAVYDLYVTDVLQVKRFKPGSKAKIRSEGLRRIGLQGRHAQPAAFRLRRSELTCLTTIEEVLRVNAPTSQGRLEHALPSSLDAAEPANGTRMNYRHSYHAGNHADNCCQHRS